MLNDKLFAPFLSAICAVPTKSEQMMARMIGFPFMVMG